MTQFFNKWLALSGIFLIMLAGTTGTAQAHILREDKGISAELHIPPDDNPAAGEPTELSLPFGDVANVFSLQNCKCKVELITNGRIVQTTVPQPALRGATLNSVATVNFPRIGVYDVRVKGSSIDGRFPDFQLDYPVHVARSVKSLPAGGNDGAVFFIGGGGVVILGLFVYNVNRNKLSRSKK